MAGDTGGLIKALGIDRAHISGESRGGMIARKNGTGSNPEAFLPQAEPCPGTLAACEAQLEAFMAFYVGGRLNTIHASTMMIIWKRDVLISPPNSFLMDRGISGAQIREIDGARNIFCISISQETVSMVTEFLG